ncbi:MAG: hypothetical protein CM15mV42_1430 [uncultured marine virus]|nr:MAG: hypothetical protein CM15mV42_1430 [uncultured marine virus]
MPTLILLTVLTDTALIVKCLSPFGSVLTDPDKPEPIVTLSVQYPAVVSAASILNFSSVEGKPLPLTVLQLSIPEPSVDNTSSLLPSAAGNV